MIAGLPFGSVLSRNWAGGFAWSVLVAFMAWHSDSHSAPAQDFSAGLISQTGASQVGLVRSWHSQAAADPGRGGIQAVRLHVSSKESLAVFEVRSDAHRWRFAEDEVDSLGMPLGKEGAKKQAALMAERLTLRGASAEVVEHVIPKSNLFITSNLGSLDSIDAETGRRVWTSQLGRPEHPTSDVGVDNDRVAVLHGSDLFVLERATGRILWKKRTRNTPIAAPAINEDLIFVPMINGAVEIYSATDPGAPVATYRALGHATAPPILTPRSAAWSTNRGHLYVAAAHSRAIRFRIEATKAIVAAPSYADQRLFVPSVDGYVYCVHEITGVMQWTFSTGEPIHQSLLVIGDSLFVVGDEGNLFHLAASDSQVRWTAPRIRQILAASTERLYCVSELEQLVVLDRATGRRLHSIPGFLPEFRFTNHQTDRIFLGSRSGLMQCLHEMGAEQPTLHIDLRESASPVDGAAPKEPSTPASDAGPGAPSAAPAADPFGAPPAKEGADPFGSPPAAGPAKTDGKGSAPAADPFKT